MTKIRQLSQLFKQYQNDLVRFVAFKFRKSSEDAEDIVQDAFHNILRQENIDDIDNPKAYLYQTAANLALNRIRKNKNHQNYLEKSVREEEDEVSPERSTLALKELHRIEEALASFPAKYRRTFEMSRVQGKSYRRISQELGIAESTVEKHIIKTLKFLRDHLSEGAK